MAIDTERDLKRVNEFLNLCEAALQIQDRNMNYFEDPRWKGFDAQIKNRLPLVEAIALELAKLAQLGDVGILTEEEFAVAKAKLLA